MKPLPLPNLRRYAPPLSQDANAARLAALPAWLEARQRVGNAKAARALGFNDQALIWTAQRAGIPVPPLPRGFTNALRKLKP